MFKQLKCVVLLISGLMVAGPSYADPISGIGGDFVLQSADGDVALKDLRGKVVLIYFGYTNCPDICPTTLQQWSRAFKRLTPEELARVQGLMVSVDPERDSVERLKVFVSFFHKNILGVTSSLENLRKVTAMFGTSFEIQQHKPGQRYGVEHSTRVFVIDPDGIPRNWVNLTTDVDVLVDLIRQRLKMK